MSYLENASNLVKQFGSQIFFLVLLLSLSLANLPSSLLMASTLSNIQHEPYDGVVYPYKHAVDWVNLRDSERDLSYNQLPNSKKIDPLKYNPSQLATAFADLGFSNHDKSTRNAKITYTVPYMGTYKLDGIEGQGSHPAVDIKLPMQTPILAIGNGVVVKAEDEPWGFGNHVVIRHDNFPSLTNSNKKETYYSGYAHMDSYRVNVGDVVSKGQEIGLSGDSGTASTPHLHFQIDNALAPWHPYWPFTGEDARKANLDFFEGVNMGLGKDQALLYTINPMAYIEQYLNNANINSDAGKINPPKIVTDDDVDSPKPPKVDVTEKPDNPSNTVWLEEEIELSSSFSLVVPRTMLLGQTYDVVVKSSKPTGNFASLSDSEMRLSSNLVAKYTIPSNVDFSTGQMTIPFEPREIGNMNITVKAGGVKLTSENIDVRLYNDINNNDPMLRGLKRLYDKKIMTGHDDGNFMPLNTLNRAEASKLIVQALPERLLRNVDLVSINFEDVTPNDWYYEYVQALASIGAIDIDRARFNGADPINLAEYLKLLTVSFGADIDPTIKEEHAEYYDTQEWYAPYLQLALDRKVITEEDASQVGEDLLRKDIARIMVEVIAKFL